jgi:hypothetical protein
MKKSEEKRADLPVFALMYDFDKTLSPKDMQEYAFIPGLGMEPKEFWKKCDDLVQENNMDQILAYMYVMRREARGKRLLTRDELRGLGAGVELFAGVESWFSRINAYANVLGMKAEHYIISSGLKEIIEGTSIAHEFEAIFAAEYYYNEYNEPEWPAMAVNYTSKTQFLFRINKGVLDVRENRGINEYMPENKRHVPFRNMIYIGDGFTDVPCMKLVREKGGHSIAVFDSDRSCVDDLVSQGRADFGIAADYSQGSGMEKAVFAILNQAAAVNETMRIHSESLERAGQRENE